MDNTHKFTIDVDAGQSIHVGREEEARNRGRPVEGQRGVLSGEERNEGGRGVRNETKRLLKERAVSVCSLPEIPESSAVLGDFSDDVAHETIIFRQKITVSLVPSFRLVHQ